MRQVPNYKPAPTRLPFLIILFVYICMLSGLLEYAQRRLPELGIRVPGPDELVPLLPSQMTESPANEPPLTSLNVNLVPSLVQLDANPAPAPTPAPDPHPPQRSYLPESPNTTFIWWTMWTMTHTLSTLRKGGATMKRDLVHPEDDVSTSCVHKQTMYEMLQNSNSGGCPFFMLEGPFGPPTTMTIHPDIYIEPLDIRCWERMTYQQVLAEAALFDPPVGMMK